MTQPQDMESMRVLGMIDAEGNPTEDEAEAVEISVESTNDAGEVTHTRIIRQPSE